MSRARKLNQGHTHRTLRSLQIELNEDLASCGALQSPLTDATVDSLPSHAADLDGVKGQAVRRSSSTWPSQSNSLGDSAQFVAERFETPHPAAEELIEILCRIDAESFVVVGVHAEAL